MADLPDPSTLSDEDLDKILNGEDLPEPGAEDADSDASTEEEDEADDKKSEEKESEEEDEKEEDESDDDKKSEEEDESKKPSRREQLRVQTLLQKMKQPQPEAPAPKSTGINYADELDTDEDTAKRLQEDRDAAVSAAVAENNKQIVSSEWRTLLSVDAPQVEKQYDYLNRKNPETFNPVLADTINSWYLDMCGFDPKTKTVSNGGMRYGEFVDAIDELAREIAGNQVATATKNIKSQAAKTGIRPSGSTAKSKLDLNKPAYEMSDEELDAKLKAVGL